MHLPAQRPQVCTTLRSSLSSRSIAIDSRMGLRGSKSAARYPFAGSGRAIPLVRAIPLAGPVYRSCGRRHLRANPCGSTTGGAGTDPSDENLGFPTLIFPELAWGWDKAPPKASLAALPTPQTASAAAWKLNLIEAIHWASFPLGFAVVHFMFVHSAAIAPAVGGDPTRVFFLLLGLLSQIFGGGISGNAMHMYEGWQVTPFRNPLALPAAPTAGELDQIRVPEYNNAWLRAVAYQMLFTFQTLGLGLFTLGAFGAKPWTVALVGGSMAVALLGPHTPRPAFNLTVDGQPRPILPLSWSLLAVFAVNVVFNFAGYHAVFGPTFAAWLGPTMGPLAPWAPLLAPSCVAAGGAIEGAVAESTFNQWWHFGAFAVLMAGLAMHGGLYWVLACRGA